MLSLLEAEAPQEKTKALAAEVKAHIPILERYLRANRPREATATVLAMLLLNAEHAISCMRRDGVLRASRYGYKGALIGRVCKAALAMRHLIGASSEQVAYLESVVALSKMAANASVLHEEILRAVRALRPVVLKTVLVTVNSLFFHEWLNDPEASSLNSRRYSSEEYAEAASLILATYVSLFPLDDGCCHHVDLTAFEAGAVIYDRLLLAAIRIAKFREAELIIDGLPYQAQLEGETVTIFSIDPNVERSVRLGYIQGQSQTMIRPLHLLEAKPAISMRDFIARGFEKASFQRLTELVEKPVRRLRVMLPAMPEMFELFASDEMFKDELENLLVLDVDNFGSMDDLLFNITEQVTSLDIFKVQRYFNFIGSMFQKRLAEIEDESERRHLTLTSTLLLIPREQLVEQMRLIFTDEAKCREIIALLTMDVKEPYLDLQYRPFVDIGNFYAIAPHIVATSNLVRNTIVVNKLRSAAIGPKDRMVESLYNVLQLAGFLVRVTFRRTSAVENWNLISWPGAMSRFSCSNVRTHTTRVQFTRCATAGIIYGSLGSNSTYGGNC